MCAYRQNKVSYKEVLYIANWGISMGVTCTAAGAPAAVDYIQLDWVADGYNTTQATIG